MHMLFEEVLMKQDLSKAGLLFSLKNSEIEQDLSKVLAIIQAVADCDEYEQSENNQSVVEICITRITLAIRETSCVEKHTEALVDLLSMCQRHPLAETGASVDPPHAKISSDLLSCLFTYYNNSHVMKFAIPVVVKLLECGNEGLLCSVSSYLSVAAIDNMHILAQHADAILDNVLKGNHSLAQIIPPMYPLNPDSVHRRLPHLITVIDVCDISDRVYLLQVATAVAKDQPLILKDYLELFQPYLGDSSLTLNVLPVFSHVASAHPIAITQFRHSIVNFVKWEPSVLCQVVTIMGSLASVSKEEGLLSMDYLTSQLTEVDQSNLELVLSEIRSVGQTHHHLLEHSLEEVEKLASNSSSSVRFLVQQIKDELVEYRSFRQSHTRSVSCQTETAIVDVDPQAADTIAVTMAHPQHESLPATTSDRFSIISDSKHVQLSNSSHDRSKTIPVSRCTGVDVAMTNSQLETYDRQALAVKPTMSLANSVKDGVKAAAASDGVQQFCDKHHAKIKSFISKLNGNIPLPSKCAVVVGNCKQAKLNVCFMCGQLNDQCLYNAHNYYFDTHLPKLWIHLMFLSVQADSSTALSQQNVNVNSLKECWDALIGDRGSSFLTVVTSSFPTQKEQLALLRELHHKHYFDVFEFSTSVFQWSCFMCSHPEKVSGLLQDGVPEIAGQLKEKKGKWKMFKRWKTRNFTLSGGFLSCSKTDAKTAALPVAKIQSVKAVRKGRRKIPRVFEIFTDDESYTFKAKDERAVEQWVQCLHIAVVRSNCSSDAQEARHLDQRSLTAPQCAGRTFKL